MGNYRFKLSDMMPNAWFYKLKDMSHRANKNRSTPHPTGKGQPSRAATSATPKPFPPPQTKLLPYRASCYYSSRTEAERFSFSPTRTKALDTNFPVEPPRKSKKRSRKKPIRAPTKPKLVTSSVSAGCSCRAWKTESVPDFPEVESPLRQRDYYIDGEDLEFQKSNFDDDYGFQCNDLPSRSNSCSCRFISSPTDIIIDMDTKTSITPKPEKLDEFDSVSELRLPPIITKPATKEPEAVKFEDKDVEDKKQSMKPSPGFHRLRMRTNSPRLSSKKVQAHRSRRCTGSTTTSATAMQKRKGLSESFAVVKSSSNPHRDFKDSMLEMIVENNIRASKDLEELLACYLSLNSREYHDVIVKVFEQIWFDLTNIKL